MLPPFFYTQPAMKIRPLYLVGMMGVGKSAIGSRLAARLGWEFIDTDVEIERREGQSIAEIFARQGERAFRRLEAETIDTVSAEKAVVIALGGGAIAEAGAVERLSERGELIYLRTSLQVLLERIGDSSSRPLLAGLDPLQRSERLAQLLEQRRPCYEKARFQIDAEGSEEEVVDRIVEALSEPDSRRTRRE